MRESITIKNSLGIYPYIMIMLGVNGVFTEGSQTALFPEIKTYNTVKQHIEISSIDFGVPYVTMNASTESHYDKDIIHNFISSILKNTKPLDADIAEFVSENFWDLI